MAEITNVAANVANTKLANVAYGNKEANKTKVGGETVGTNEVGKAIPAEKVAYGTVIGTALAGGEAKIEDGKKAIVNTTSVWNVKD